MARLARFAAALVLLGQFVAAATPAPARWIADPDDGPDLGGTSGGGPPPYYPPVNGFNWSAPDRYSKWASAWRAQGRAKNWAVETYDPNYVNPQAWNLTFMGCETEADYLYDVIPSGEGVEKTTTLYQWKWDGRSTTFSQNCYTDLLFPAQGTYWVELNIKRKDGTTKSWSKPVRVKDHLIVVLGDSSASGEGAPDQRLYPWSSSDARAEWVDNRCHRSANAGGAQAARRLENADPYSSVTFLSFACSGATLNTQIYDGSTLDPYENEEDHGYRGIGITGPYSGIEPLKFTGQGLITDPPDFSQKLPGQVDQLWTALRSNGVSTTRTIDALIVAGGINDARFADLAAVCVLYHGCPLELVGETPGTQRFLHDQFVHDVNKVPAGWNALGNQLNQTRQVKPGVSEKIKVNKKLALQYPPFFRNQNGNRCTGLFYDTIPWYIKLLLPSTITTGWDALEIAHAEDDWAVRLDTKVREGALNNDFTYVDTIAARFYLHGMCSSDNWINTPTESAAIQGDDTGEAGALASLFSKGTAHPNTAGYAAYADEILRHLEHLAGEARPPVAVSDFFNAGSGWPSWHNVLANDSDPDGDQLTVRLVTGPEHGQLKLSPDGLATYKSIGGYIGRDGFSYEVTDGVFSRTAFVEIDVVKPFKVVTQVLNGESTVIGGLLGNIPMEGPYTVAFDKLPPPKRGTINPLPGSPEIYYETPDRPRGGTTSLRVRYHVYSNAPITSPDYGKSVRGVLRIRVVNRLR